MKTHDQFFEKLGSLQSTIGQLGKALCGNENARLHEILKAANQVKNELEMARAERDAINQNRIDLATRLAEVERERDAAVALAVNRECHTCKHRDLVSIEEPCNTCIMHSEGEHLPKWQWRGVCEENTKEDSNRVSSVL